MTPRAGERPGRTSHRHAIDAVWKLESARIIAGLTRMVHDVGLAEELAQDALVAALEQWPETGVPDNPGAWLTAIAKRRAIDHIRRVQRLDRKHEQLARELDAAGSRARDDVLRLMFLSCHPVLPTEARVALTLRLLGGLTRRPRSRGRSSSPRRRIAQRIAAAKRTLAEARVPFELPGRRGAGRAAVLGARGRLPDLQRGVLGDLRRRPDAARALPGGAAAGPAAGRAGARTRPRCTGWSR